MTHDLDFFSCVAAWTAEKVGRMGMLFPAISFTVSERMTLSSVTVMVCVNFSLLSVVEGWARRPFDLISLPSFRYHSVVRVADPPHPPAES